MTLASSVVSVAVVVVVLICAYRLGYSDGRYHDEAIEELKRLREGK